MKILKPIKLLGVLAVLFAASCTNTVYLTADSPGTATIRFYKDNQSTSKDRYIAPKNVDIKYTYSSLDGMLSKTKNVCPSTGDVNLLVVPVHVPSENEFIKDEATRAKVKEDINKAFFSENDPSLGYKSVKEYYHEASYGKLNLNGTVTDWFDATTVSSIKTEYDVTSGTDGTIMNDMLPAILDWLTASGVDLTQYDSNKDGAIDGLWLVYDHLDYITHAEQNLLNDRPVTDGYNTTFWNYTAFDLLTTVNPNAPLPTTSAFSWSSISSMYTGYCPLTEEGYADLSNLDSIKIDSHTFIHETGHLFGLDDLYSTSDDKYHPAGCSTMMDYNVGDLDPLSKLLLGWVTPYIVYGTSEILIEKSNKNDHSVIVIPSNFEEISAEIEAVSKSENKDKYVYEFNPFSEYLIIDYYTPDGLNEIDVKGPLLNDRKACMEESGIRIYHADARLFEATLVQSDLGVTLSYPEGYVWDENPIASNQSLIMAISNSYTESSYYNLPEEFDFFDQLRLIEANGLNSFDKGYWADHNTLFNLDTEPFSISTYGYQFFGGNYTFNGGNEIPFLIKPTTLKEVN